MLFAFGLALAVAAHHPAALHDGRIKLIEPEIMQPGESGEISVTILDEPQRDTPIALDLQSDSVGLLENRLSAADVVDPQAEQPRLLARVVAPDVPGEYAVDGRIQYITCDDHRCRPRLAFVRWSIVVADLSTADVVH